jgi:hypothetical protein
MSTFNKAVAATFVGIALAGPASAQSANELRGASPYVSVENEPPPRLIVDPPLADQLARGVVEIQYHAEHLHIVPVFGEGALAVSPRIGHLHVTVDDLPWHWTDASDNNTIGIVGLPPGRHSVRIELADARHHAFPGQAVTLFFAVPAASTHAH